MADQISDLQTVARRLKALEKENRKFKRAVFLLLLLVGTLVLMGQGKPNARTVEVEKFVLRNRAGEMRALFAVEDDAAVLQLYDAGLNPRTKITVSKFGPSVSLYDSESKVRAVLGVADAGPSFKLYDSEENPGFFVGLDKSGPRLIFPDASGKKLAWLGVNGDGPGFFLYDTNEKGRAGMWIAKDSPVLVLSDANEKPRAGITVAENLPLIQVNDADGKVIWSAPPITTSPNFTTLSGKPRVFIEAWSITGIFKPSREAEPSQEMATFGQRCPLAIVTRDQQNADYTLRLDKYLGEVKATGVDRAFRYLLFDAAGNQIGVGPVVSLLSDTLDAACASIRSGGPERR